MLMSDFKKYFKLMEEKNQFTMLNKPNIIGLKNWALLKI